MLRRALSLTLVAVVAIAAVSFAGDGESKWFDMENCGMCKNLNHEGMLEAMTWEQYGISNGVVAVTNVKPDFLEKYREAHKGMEATGAKMMAGEKIEMCGSCTALGMCFMKGAKQEYIPTKTGDIWIVMSDNPDVVADLHTWMKKNQKAMESM